MELVNVLPGKEEVTELREHVGTSIAKFSKDNNTFQADFEKHLEIIRRYDEVLSNKASKHSVIELDKNMSEKYNQQIDDLLRLINENVHDINIQKERFDEFGKALTAEIYAAVDKATVRHNRQQRAEAELTAPKIMGISTIKTEGESGIIKVLSLKADKAEIDRLDEGKQDKEDAQNLMDIMVEMNSQI